MEYPIIKISEKFEIEPLGTKAKFWVYDNNNKKLFKIGRERTGENWAEKVACEIARLIELPAANYEFARYQDKLGVLSESIIEDNERLVHGNELLGKLVKNYPKEQFYKVREYKINTVLALMKWMEQKIKVENCLFNFIGYLIFDCLIANQDRHHENWGFIVRRNQQIDLAPSFDHASSLGCRVQRDEIINRLKTKDKNYTIKAFCKKAKTPFYNNKRLSTLEVLTYALKFNKQAVCFWIKKISQLNFEVIEKILSKIPSEFYNYEESLIFAKEILKVNITRLNKFYNERCL